MARKKSRTARTKGRARETPRRGARRPSPRRPKSGIKAPRKTVGGAKAAPKGRALPRQTAASSQPAARAAARVTAPWSRKPGRLPDARAVQKARRQSLRSGPRARAREFPAADACSFLARAAPRIRSRPPSSTASAAITYAEFYARSRRLGSALARTRASARRHGFGAARQHAADAGGPSRRADDGRRAERAQHAARCRRHRLHARSCGGEGLHRRPRVRGDRAKRPGAREGEAAAHRL